MATITSTIKLVDQMTPTLNKISKAIDRVNSQSKAIGSAKTWNGFNTGVTTATKSTHNLYNALRRAVFMLGALRGLQGLTNIADTMMNANARINNITGDLAKTKYYMDAIYQSAQRSRSGFMETANSVGKLATLAGSAFEGSMEQVIAFTELMNKMFVISGASAAESSNAMYQLTQAMAAGKLQGDEMRSILENAPMLAQKLAEKLGVSVGEIKELGAEGKITADIIKDVLFASADEIETKFENMPKTIGQTWTEIKNAALRAFQPVIDRVQQFINSPIFEKFKTKVISILQSIANAVIRLFDAFEDPRVHSAVSAIAQALQFLWSVVSWVAQAIVIAVNWIGENWHWLQGIVYGVIGAFLVYKAVVLIIAAVEFILNAANFLLCTTFGQVILIIALLIIWFYSLIDTINQTTGSTISATGAIFGAIAFVVVGIYDLIVGVVYALATIGAAVVFAGQVIWTTFVNICNVLGALIWNIIAFILNCVFALGNGVWQIGLAIWDTLVWIGQMLDVITGNIVKFIGNLLVALGTAIAEIGINIWNTFRWLGDVISTWAGNIKSGMSQLCEQLPLYWELFKAKTTVTFWSLVLNAGLAFNNMLDKASELCKKMIKPFEGFANAVIDCLNSIIDGWNWLCEQLTFTIPGANVFGYQLWDDIEVSVLGGGIEKIGKVSWDDWESPSVNLSGVAANLDTARGNLASIAGQIKDINWSETPIPSYSEYADWSSVKNAFLEGFKTFEYDAIPDYNVDWGAVIDGFVSGFNKFQYEDILGNWDNSGYADAWNTFSGLMSDWWSSDNFKNPVDAFKNWYEKGENFENGVSDVISGIGALLDGLFNGGSSDINPGHNFSGGGFTDGNGAGRVPSSIEDLLGAPGDISDALGNIADNTGSTAGSVGNIEDTLDLAEEELELLRKLAEQEVINRFTTAEIHVDMTNNNNVSSNMDLDGIVTHLSNKLYEELGVVASGVHY